MGRSQGGGKKHQQRNAECEEPIPTGFAALAPKEPKFCSLVSGTSAVFLVSSTVWLLLHFKDCSGGMSREDFELQALTPDSASAEWDSWVVLQEDNSECFMLQSGCHSGKGPGAVHTYFTFQGTT